MPDSTIGVILAGGQATRMGGGDKCLLEVEGRPLLDIILDRLRPQVDAVILNANGDPARFAAWDLTVVPDSIDGFAGPLAGVLAGMDRAAEMGAREIVTVAGDTPYFPTFLAAALKSAAFTSGLPLSMAMTPDPERGLSRHPTFGLWPVALRDDLRAALDAGDPQGHRLDRPAWLRAGHLRHRWRRSLLQCQHARGPGPAEGEDGMRIYGVVGWKDQGKTTLVERLVSHFSARGLRVSTVKHAHHAFDVDQEGRDSHRHRVAGATEVLLSSRRRFALMHELREEREWEVPDLLARMTPVDLVLIEGYKEAAHRKIELYRRENDRGPVALSVPNVRAIAGDAAAHGLDLPQFSPDDIEAIAAFIDADAEDWP